MTPIYQKGTHDCFRACLASLMNLRWLDVPDFYEGVADGHYLGREQKAKLEAWFAARDLYYVELAYRMEPSDLLITLGDGYPGLTAILMGNTLNGAGHSVIIRGSEIIHDPQHSRPSSLSIARPCSDGYSRLGIVSIQTPDFPAPP